MKEKVDFHQQVQGENWLFVMNHQKLKFPCVIEYHLLGGFPNIHFCPSSVLFEPGVVFLCGTWEILCCRTIWAVGVICYPYWAISGSIWKIAEFCAMDEKLIAGVVDAFEPNNKENAWGMTSTLQLDPCFCGSPCLLPIAPLFIFPGGNRAKFVDGIGIKRFGILFVFKDWDTALSATAALLFPEISVSDLLDEWDGRCCCFSCRSECTVGTRKLLPLIFMPVRWQPCCDLWDDASLDVRVLWSWLY